MNFFRKFRDFISTPTHKRTLGFLGILTFVGIISLTVIVAQQQQQTKQRASETLCSLQAFGTIYCPSGQFCRAKNDSDGIMRNNGACEQVNPAIPSCDTFGTGLACDATKYDTICTGKKPNKCLSQKTIFSDSDFVGNKSVVCCNTPASTPTPFPCSTYTPHTNGMTADACKIRSPRCELKNGICIESVSSPIQPDAIPTATPTPTPAPTPTVSLYAACTNSCSNARKTVGYSPASSNDTCENACKSLATPAPTATPTPTPTPATIALVPTATPVQTCANSNQCVNPPGDKSCYFSPAACANGACLYAPAPSDYSCSTASGQGKCDGVGKCVISLSSGSQAIPPTATPIPTPAVIALAPTNTPTPTPPTAYLLALSVKADGIGILSGENKGPRRQNKRSIAVTVRYPNTQDVITKSGTLNYSTATGVFTGVIDLGTGLLSNVPTDLISVKMDTMRGFAPNTILKQGINAPPQITIRTGLDDDNNIDSVTYYEILRSCFNGRTSCKNLSEADLNDDGKADGIDYNIFIKSIKFIQDRATQN